MFWSSKNKNKKKHVAQSHRQDMVLCVFILAKNKTQWSPLFFEKLKTQEAPLCFRCFPATHIKNKNKKNTYCREPSPRCGSLQSVFLFLRKHLKHKGPPCFFDEKCKTQGGTLMFHMCSTKSQKKICCREASPRDGSLQHGVFGFFAF